MKEKNGKQEQVRTTDFNPAQPRLSKKSVAAAHLKSKIKRFLKRIDLSEQMMTSSLRFSK